MSSGRDKVLNRAAGENLLQAAKPVYKEEPFCKKEKTQNGFSVSLTFNFYFKNCLLVSFYAVCTVIMSADEHAQNFSVYFNNRRKIAARLLGLFQLIRIVSCWWAEIRPLSVCVWTRIECEQMWNKTLIRLVVLALKPRRRSALGVGGFRSVVSAVWRPESEQQAGAGLGQHFWGFLSRVF